MSQAAAAVTFTCTLCITGLATPKELTRSQLKAHLKTHHLQRLSAPDRIQYDELALFLGASNLWACTICNQVRTRSRTFEGVSNREKLVCNCGDPKLPFDLANTSHVGGLEGGNRPEPQEALIAVGAEVPQPMEEVVAPEVFNPWSDNPNLFKDLLALEIRTIPKLPKSTVALTSKILTTCLRRVVSNPQDMNAHGEMAILPKLLLHRIPSVAHNSRGRNLSKKAQQTKYTLARLNRYDKANPAEKREMLAEITLLGDPNRSRGTPTPKPQKSINSQRAGMKISLGLLKDAMLALTQEGLCEFNEAVKNALQALCPEKPAPLPSAGDPCVPFSLSFEDHTALSEALLSFKNGSGAGLDGFYPQYYKDILQSRIPADADQYLTVFASYINKLLAASFPPELAEYLSASRLLALKKKDSVVPRPIMLGLALSRVVSKICVKGIKDAIMEEFNGSQVGVGVPCGSEGINHTINHLLATGKIEYLSQVDWSNAFNTVDRETIFREIRRVCPSILKWVEATYGGRQIALLGDGTWMKICTGVRQGDPLSPALFSLALMVVIRKIREECPLLVLNAWYLDDGTMVGSKEDILKALEVLEREGREIGLEINPSKCVVWAPGVDPNFDGFPPAFVRATDGIKSLGVPVGSEAMSEHMLQKKLKEILEMIKNIETLATLQQRLLLLQACSLFPKLCHILRSVPGAKIPTMLNKAEEALYNAVSSFVGGTSLTDAQKLRCHLPIKLGGCSITNPKIISNAAYIGSRIQSAKVSAMLLGVPLEDITAPIKPLVDGFYDGTPTGQRPSLETLLTVRHPQTTLSLHINTCLLNKTFFSNEVVMSNLERNHVLACAVPGSGDWMRCIPKWGSHESHMNDDVIRTCFRLRLAMQVYTREAKCPHCKFNLDVRGHHAMHCAGGTHTCTARHNGIRDLLARKATEGGKPNRLEVTGIALGIPEIGVNRPADLLLHDYHNNMDKVVDVTVVNSLEEAAEVVPADFEPMAIYHKKANIKIRRVEHLVRAANKLYGVFACGSLGGFNEKAEEIIRFIGKGLASAHNVHESSAIAKLRQEISVVVQVAQAASIVSKGLEAGILRV